MPKKPRSKNLIIFVLIDLTRKDETIRVHEKYTFQKCYKPVDSYVNPTVIYRFMSIYSERAERAAL
jgi:hypothetical protein